MTASLPVAPLRIDVTTAIGDPAGWDGVVAADDAPIFYRSEFLRAYQHDPLGETLAIYYLTARSALSGRIEAVLPMFLIPATDPLGVLPRLFPGFRQADRPLLLSHVWHWYDTRLPGCQPTAALLDAVCARLRELAADCGAQAFGFMNIARDGALARALTAAGHPVREIDARYTLDLRGFGSAEDYLATLRRAVRHDLRRQLRRAAAADAKITVAIPTPQDLPVVARLCQATAARHGNPGWYDPQRLARFAASVRAHVRLVAIEVAGQPLAASISFLDGRRFHNWTAGSVRPAGLTFSPYAVLLHATVQAALDAGCEVLEGGRRNDHWKERLGLRRRPLCGWLAQV
jgi:hypothetical protein